MENKRVAMLVVMMLVMGNILVETESEGISFGDCYIGCNIMCRENEHGFKRAFCPAKCLKECAHPQLSFETNLKETDKTYYFCKFGCATDRCVSSSLIQDKDHAKKVSACVDSCSEMCYPKN